LCVVFNKIKKKKKKKKKKGEGKNRGCLLDNNLNITDGFAK
jgi:hypothetical protein